MAASKEQVIVDLDIPNEYRDACEQVREHLVSLRGRAPFLSPADVMVLLDWLDAGVSVVSILLAIERLAESRKKRASRAPFTLSKAKRHLGKPAKANDFSRTAQRVLDDTAARETSRPQHPLSELVGFLREDAAGNAPHPGLLETLADDLEGLQEPWDEAMAQNHWLSAFVSPANMASPRLHGARAIPLERR